VHPGERAARARQPRAFLEATLFRPPGAGPFPLAVLSHGSPREPDRLVEAMGSYGRTTAVPTLWLYAENDLFFGPSLAREMHAAFRRGGGAAELLVLPSFGSDGHHLFTLDTGIPQWAPAVDRFLATLGFRSA
jgi:pimeloyl-ACP methyl ester carboxylesterase